MDADKRKRIIEKLRRLADPSRNPDQEEVLAANTKLEELLREEEREVVTAIHLRQKKEPMELQTLFTWEQKPLLWERELFGFVCRINWTKGLYTFRNNLFHLFRIGGRPAQIRKAELQFLWAHGRVKDVSKRLPTETQPKYRESYELGAAAELVKAMKEAIPELGNSKEAGKWLKEQVAFMEEPEKITALDPYWREGRKSLKRSFYPDE
ncbi:MAG: hypothetical protein GF334_10365 [Candidatus Altiarchaeales archaeon]|nr:hypothetical protein [Candidatus Altiarchaeales archaeon]